MKKSIILASAFIAALFVSGCASAHGYKQPNKNANGYHQQYQQKPNGHYRPGYSHNYRPNNQYKSNNHYQTKHGYRAPSNGRFNSNVKNPPRNNPRW